MLILHTETLKATIVEKNAEQETFRAKIKEYEHNLADSKGYRERQLKEAKDNMTKTKALSDKSRKEWDKHEKDAEILKLEIEELTKTIAESKEEIDGCDNKVKELQQKVSDLLPFQLNIAENTTKNIFNFRSWKIWFQQVRQQRRRLKN